MARFLKIFCTTAALAMGAVFWLPDTASADFELAVQYSTDGVNWTNAAAPMTITPGSTTLSASFNVGTEFSVTDTVAVSNSPGDLVNGANLEQNDVVVSAGTGYSGSGTLFVRASAQGYSLPGVSPPLAALTSSSTLTTGHGATTEVTTSSVDLTDALFGASGATTDPLTLAGTNGVPNNGMGSGQDTTFFTLSAVPYSLTNELAYTFSGGKAGQVLAYDGNASTTVTTPAPSTAVFALTGLPLLGLGVWVRRRMSRKAPVAA